MWNSFLTMMQVAALIGLDAVPTLWRFVVGKQKELLEGTDLPHLWISEGFDRNAMFVICCYIAFLIINIPTYFYRALVLKENKFFGRKNCSGILDVVAKGRPISAILVSAAVCAYEFEMFGLKFHHSYILVVAGLQLLFIILYPVFIQPRSKTLSVMEPGWTKDAIKQLAGAAEFPLKDVFIIDDQDRRGVQVFGLPKQKYIAIPKIMVEEDDEIVGLAAHAMGSWKFSNGLRVFMVGQMYFNTSWIYLTIFENERTNYAAFGFKNEYPRMAAILIFAISFAPFLAAILGLQINYMGRKNDFMAGECSFDQHKKVIS